MLLFPLFETLLLYGLFFGDLSGIGAHITTGIAAVQDMLLMIAMRLFDVSPFVSVHAIVFGNLQLLVNGYLILMQSAAMPLFVVFVAHVKLDDVFCIALDVQLHDDRTAYGSNLHV
jgi:hypothetical protein